MRSKVRLSGFEPETFVSEDQWTTNLFRLVVVNGPNNRSIKSRFREIFRNLLMGLPSAANAGCQRLLIGLNVRIVQIIRKILSFQRLVQAMFTKSVKELMQRPPSAET